MKMRHNFSVMGKDHWTHICNKCGCFIDDGEHYNVMWYREVWRKNDNIFVVVCTGCLSKHVNARTRIKMGKMLLSIKML